ncbi:cytochrome P450 [Actinocorallia sp. API 0066]|uniref:cytochrome P450 n=1 Tax=Actinocorallia sp. API 0066 TaxID=2896846 RepID=UPI001E5E64D0|nr:cytochrome P450 [Actinocorallia sp. API 0066]MCD0452062.1 cytochrome P450 [Actinocorallia sp. API 0066]
MGGVRERVRVGGVARVSAWDGAVITGGVLVPLVARGLLARWPLMVDLGDLLDADRRSTRLLAAMRRKYGYGNTLLVRLPGRRLALVLDAEGVRRVLEGEPEPFAVANLEKRHAVGRFQPRGVLVSSGPERHLRRQFNEEVLDTGRGIHRLSEAFTRVVREEARLLLDLAEDTDLRWEALRVCWARVLRRVVLGDGARDDHAVTDTLFRLRREANWGYAPRSERTYREFRGRLEGHLRRAEPNSLAGVLAATPQTPETAAYDQVPQWLFAFDSAGLVLFRALALLTSHPVQDARARTAIVRDPVALGYLRACVLESVRLWPTTPAILRDATRDVDLGGDTLPGGTAVLIPATFVQRDAASLPYADSFTPDVWLDGSAADSWSVVPFSGGPAECPGRDLVMLTTSVFLAELVRDHVYRQTAGRRLSPGLPLPGSFSPYRLRFAVRRLGERGGDGR